MSGSIHQVGNPHKPKILRVLPKGHALVPDYSVNTHPTGTLRLYHGWDWDTTVGEKLQEQDSRTGKWAPSGKLSGALKRTESQVYEVPDTAEYRRHLVGDPRSPQLGGDLWPADKETADAVGIPFWPGYPDIADPKTKQTVPHPLRKQFAAEHPEHAEMCGPKSPQTGTRVPVSSEVTK